MGPHTCQLRRQELGRRATKSSRTAEATSEFHVRLGYRVRLYFPKKRRKNDARTNLSNILRPVHPVWIAQVISDLGEGRSEADEVM